MQTKHLFLFIFCFLGYGALFIYLVGKEGVNPNIVSIVLVSGFILLFILFLYLLWFLPKRNFILYIRNFASSRGLMVQKKPSELLPDVFNHLFPVRNFMGTAYTDIFKNVSFMMESDSIKIFRSSFAFVSGKNIQHLCMLFETPSQNEDHSIMYRTPLERKMLVGASGAMFKMLGVNTFVPGDIGPMFGEFVKSGVPEIDERCVISTFNKPELESFLPRITDILIKIGRNVPMYPQNLRFRIVMSRGWTLILSDILFAPKLEELYPTIKELKSALNHSEVS